MVLVLIPCHVRKFLYERYFPFISFSISFQGIRGLKALIDTGSPFTAISTRDTIRLRLPIKRWRKTSNKREPE